MALVILGSRRVTRDFDFVIPPPGERLTVLIDVLYDRGLELVSRVDRDGNPRSSISNRRVTAVRLQLDARSSVHFVNGGPGFASTCCSTTRCPPRSWDARPPE